MADEREQELKRLEQELLADEVVEEYDLLSDLPIELLDTRPLSWNEDDEIRTDDAIADEEELPGDDILSAEAALSVDDIINETLKETELPLGAEPHEGESMNNSKKTAQKNSKADQKREDRWLIILMAIASFLCMGIIGVLIYWMEVFLK